MYTIKINLKENISNTGDILDTSYYEASTISTKIYSRGKNTSVDELLAKIKEDKIGDFLFHNTDDKAWNILHMSYFNDRGDFINLLVFGNANVYIMQSGKTIDTIYV